MQLNHKLKTVGNLNSYKKIMPYIKPNKKFLTFMVILDMIYFASIILQPLILAKVLIYFTSFDFSKIVFYSLLFGGTIIVGKIIQTLSQMCMHRWIRASAYLLQNDLIQRFTNIENIKLDYLNSGKISTRLINDVNKIFFSLSRAITEIIHAFAGIIYIVIAFIFNIYIALFLLLASICFYLTNSYYSYKTSQKDYIKQAQQDIIAGFNNEITRSWKDIKALGIKNNLIAKSFVLNEKYMHTSIKLNDKLQGHSLWIEFVQVFFEIVFWILCGWFMLKGWLELATFLVLYMYKNKVYESLNAFKEINQELYSGNLAIIRVFELYNEEEYPLMKYGTKTLKNCLGNIEISNLTFSYDGKYNVLNNINLVIPANNIVAFVGESGVGKSTLIQLITKSYHLQNGNIYIDQFDIEDLDEKSLSENISIISQIPYLFNLSIKENLRLVKPNATQQQIESVCKQAQIDDFILSLENSYDSIVGENGIILSGGQKQRLAIARALLKDSKILIFDESTSALDNISQQKIKDVLFKLKENHTILIVAHRLSTINDADNIVVLEKGEIIAQGKHATLLRCCKKYKMLYQKEMAN